MAFVKAVGLAGDVKIVPRSMFECYLKNIGYREVNNVSKPKEENWSNENMDKSESADLESIPISEMSGKQLKEFARMKNIDVSGARKTEEAREIIREWMQENGE